MLSEKQALVKLRRIKDLHRQRVRDGYEPRAKDCLTCETQGACCLDAHFVNVHVTRLEAVLIRGEIDRLPPARRAAVLERNADAIATFGLRSAGDSFAKTFACPLFEKGTGCLVHAVKPVPCVQHACYENPADLPPDELQTGTEAEIERLNRRAYSKAPAWRPLPVALAELAVGAGSGEPDQASDLPHPSAEDRHRHEQDEKDQVIPDRKKAPDARLDADPDQQQDEAEDHGSASVVGGENGREVSGGDREQDA
jgi:hypothetical protein